MGCNLDVQYYSAVQDSASTHVAESRCNIILLLLTFIPVCLSLRRSLHLIDVPACVLVCRPFKNIKKENRKRLWSFW